MFVESVVRMSAFMGLIFVLIILLPCIPFALVSPLLLALYTVITVSLLSIALLVVAWDDIGMAIRLSASACIYPSVRMLYSIVKILRECLGAKTWVENMFMGYVLRSAEISASLRGAGRFVIKLDSDRDSCSISISSTSHWISTSKLRRVLSAMMRACRCLGVSASSVEMKYGAITILSPLWIASSLGADVEEIFCREVEEEISELGELHRCEPLVEGSRFKLFLEVAAGSASLREELAIETLEILPIAIVSTNARVELDPTMSRDVVEELANAASIVKKHVRLLQKLLAFPPTAL